MRATRTPLRDTRTDRYVCIRCGIEQTHDPRRKAAHQCRDCNLAERDEHLYRLTAAGHTIRDAAKAAGVRYAYALDLLRDEASA